MEDFCKKCSEIDIDGLIIPDLPIDYYETNYKSIFKDYGLYNLFLIAPQTPEERIRHIDKISDGFIYMVSSSSVTGSKDSFDSDQLTYFKKIEKMNLSTKRIIGFGIGSKNTYETATQYSKGAIIGSSFIKNLQDVVNGSVSTTIFDQASFHSSKLTSAPSLIDHSTKTIKSSFSASLTITDSVLV